MKHEADLRRVVMDWLGKQPDVYAVNYSTGMHGTAGTPDVLCCVGGMFAAFELKSDTGKPTALQTATLSRIVERAGGRAHVVRTLDEVKQTVEFMRLCMRVEVTP